MTPSVIKYGKRDIFSLLRYLAVFEFDFSAIKGGFEFSVLFKSICRFRDRRSPVMEVILVLTHSRWWDKAYIPYMEYVVYICFRMSFAYFACQ